MRESDEMKDYGRRVLLDAEYRASEQRRLAAFRRKIDRSLTLPTDALAEGVSIIVPTYLGRSRIVGMLDSIAHQDLGRDEFEVIVVTNGPEDGTRAVVESVAAETGLDVRVFHSLQASAGGARNRALAAARRRYVTFIDDDDRIEPGYLSSLLAKAGPTRIVSAPIVDQHPDGTLSEESVLAVRLRELESRSTPTPVETVPWILGLSACKLIPTELAQAARYAADLRSGEDVAYMASLLGHGVSVVAATGTQPRAYVRVLRDDSISRRELDFQFSVMERLAVIRELLERKTAQSAATAVRQIVEAQAGFIGRYLDANPDEHDRVVDAIVAENLHTFPWSVVNKGRARDLAISYCFAPYLDSSGVVAAKAIAERDRMVDVISADMKGVRHKDAAVGILAERWIDAHAVIDVKASFTGWKEISDFARKAAAQADTWHAVKGGYETMYSRALWVGSNVAGALFKLNHWDVRWTAEFSDPLGRGVDGTRRPGAFVENDVTDRLRRAIRLAGVEIPDDVTLFEFVELATYVLADEIIFTNANQQEYMQSLVPPKVAALVAAKAVVRPHPAPVPEAYKALPGSYKMPAETVNIGYFGSFYGNRTLDEVLVAMANLSAAERALLRLHVFCNKPKEFTAEIARYGLSANVYVNSYLSYMDFLSVSTRFDALIVKDVDSAGSFAKNPFLPSKYSDYKGAGVPVWGIVEDGSPLSGQRLDHRSAVGDSVGALKVISRILKTGTNDTSSLDNDLAKVQAS